MIDYDEYMNQKEEEVMTRTKPVPHPWIRYFARSLDLFIYGVIWEIIERFVLRISIQGDTGRNLISLFVSIGLMLLIEPVLLSRLGTTPGKTIFGLKVRDQDGNKLSYLEAFGRTWTVIKVGMGLGIPFYSIYRNYRSYVTCKDEQLCEWELDCTYEIRDTKGWRILIYFAVFAVVIGINATAVVMSRLPVNRGSLTEVEFYENYNDLMNYNGFDSGYELTETGTWLKLPSDTVTFNVFEQTMPEFDILEVDGDILEVVMIIDGKNSDWVRSQSTDVYLAYMSFVGAQKGINPLSVFDKEMVKLIEPGYEDFNIAREGIEISYDVEYEGYENVGSMLIAEEGEDQQFRLILKMRKVTSALDVEAVEAVYSAEDNFGVTMARLVYASDEQVIFRAYGSMFIYDLKEEKMVREVALSTIDCGMIQGSEASWIEVNRDGSVIQIQKSSSDHMYIYDYETNTFRESISTPMSDSVELLESIDVIAHADGLVSYSCVKFGEDEYGYLETEDYTAKTLVYVRGEKRYQLFE